MRKIERERRRRRRRRRETNTHYPKKSEGRERVKEREGRRGREERERGKRTWDLIMPVRISLPLTRQGISGHSFIFCVIAFRNSIRSGDPTA